MIVLTLFLALHTLIDSGANHNPNNATSAIGINIFPLSGSRINPNFLQKAAASTTVLAHYRMLSAHTGSFLFNICIFV